jgi:hypothetical protein
MRRILITFVMLSFVLTSCGTLEIGLDVTPTPNLGGSDPIPSPAAPIFSMGSTSEEIQHAMITSATHWQTIWMDGTTTEYVDGVPSQTTREQVWIEQATPKFRVLQSSTDINTPATLKSSDGLSILDLDLITGQSNSAPMPEGIGGQYVPPLQPGVANPNPIWGQIGTRISELAFPSDFAQNEGTSKPLAIEVIAGRNALAVEWTYIQNNLPSWKLWLDVETAVILKAQFFQKTGGEPLMNERVVNQVVYNAVFDNSLFGIPSVTPQFEDVTGVAANAGATEAVVPSGKDALGQLYFFTLPHQAGQSAQLVRLPGSCVVGLLPCPQLETVNVPFAFDFTLYPLAWSPNGKFAAFAYSDNPNGTPQKVFLFDPAADTWSSLAEFPYIDPPFWSSDGIWVAFRVQDGAGGEDVYAIRHDGTELKNLTASGSLPAEGRPYVMDGWLTENIIVRSALPGSNGGVYLLRVSDGTLRPMFETLLTKATFIPAPDNSSIAYDDYDYNSQKHAIKLMEPDGGNSVEAVTFAGGSVYPLIWSPDSTRLAFAHSSNDSNFNPISDVYVIGRDGRGMTQVYKGSTVGRILFSPDGKYLLVEETTSATGGHLFAINLDTLEQKILSAPGLSLDMDWYAPSWRP